MKTGLKLTSLLLFASIFLVVITACEKDLFDPKKINTDGWNPTFAIPLTNSKLVLKDLIPTGGETEQFVNIDSVTGEIIISYKGDLLTVEANEIVKIPTQNQSSSVSFDIPEFPNSGVAFTDTVTQSDSIFYNFDAGDSIKVHQLGFAEGDMNFVIIGAIGFQTKVTVTMNSLIKDGQPAILNFLFAGTGNQETVTQNIDLNGYTMDLTLGELGHSELYIEYEYEFIVDIPATGRPEESISFSVDQGFENIEFGNIVGDLGNQIFDLDRDSIELAVFENSLGDIEYEKFEVAEPAINILLTSSIGVPLNLNVNTLSAYEPESETHTDIQLESNTFSIQSPAAIGDSVTSTIPITGENSNLGDVLTPTNKVITYEFGAELNPNGPATNFITPDARISVQAEMELPLEVGIKGWVLQDTIDFTIDAESMDLVENAAIKVLLDNGFPFEIGFQAYFADSNGVLLDSLIHTDVNLMNGAQVNASGDVIASSLANSDIVLSSKTIENLGKTGKIIIKAALATSNNGQRVKIYNNYELGVRMGIIAGVDGSSLLNGEEE